MDNLNIKPIYENSELMRYDISPADGYILRVKCCDQTYEENGKIIFRPYRTLGDAGVVKTYDFENNPSGFIAESYVEGMENEIIETDIPETATETDYINALERLGVNFNE